MVHPFSTAICIVLLSVLVACSPGSSIPPVQSGDLGATPLNATPNPAESATPTLTAPMKEPTVEATITSPPVEAQVLSFQVSPTMTLRLGETILIEWQAAGERADLCWLDGSGPTTCQSVPLAGSSALQVDEPALSMTGVGLQVTQGAGFVWAIAELAIQCQDVRDWFFADPPRRCPAEDAQFSPAAAQLFEHGFMIWTETPDVFYVLFQEQSLPQGKTYLRFSPPYDFGPEQPVSETPPADRLAPVSGFGKLWWGELNTPLDDNLRARLGWAVGPEFAFESAHQCEVRSHPRSWTCYLQAPDGQVLRLWPDSTAQVNLLWRPYNESD